MHSVWKHNAGYVRRLNDVDQFFYWIFLGGQKRLFPSSQKRGVVLLNTITWKRNDAAPNLFYNKHYPTSRIVRFRKVSPHFVVFGADK